MLPEHRLFGGLAVLALGAIIVFALQLFDFGFYILAALAVLFLVWLLGSVLYAVARDLWHRLRALIDWVRERRAKP